MLEGAGKLAPSSGLGKKAAVPRFPASNLLVVPCGPADLSASYFPCVISLHLNVAAEVWATLCRLNSVTATPRFYILSLSA